MERSFYVHLAKPCETWRILPSTPTLITTLIDTLEQKTVRTSGHVVCQVGWTFDSRSHVFGIGRNVDFGVHINSGIINKAFVLMVQGGVHPVSNVAVPPLNPDFDASILEAARIVYDANTKCLTANADFLMARQCTLLFATSAQVDAVSKAWDAVGVVEPAAVGTCVAINGRCSAKEDCCGKKKLTCTGLKGNRTCRRCKRQNRRCQRGTECCRGLKCKLNRCSL